MLRAQVSHAVRLAARRSHLTRVLKVVLRRVPVTAACVRRGRSAGWQAAAQWLLSSGGRAILEDKRWLAELRSDINRDIEEELLLTAVRAELLREPQRMFASPAMRSFCCALLAQCHNNEHVWFVANEERPRLHALTTQLGTRRPANAVDWQTTLVLALYQPLYQLLRLQSEAEALEEGALTALPEPFQAWVRGYCAEHEEEAAGKAVLPMFAPIRDEGSLTVRAMYEVYPYPRWVKLQRPSPGSRARRLAAIFSPQEIEFLKRPFDVLVPGCGTGRKAIQIALGFPAHARILATDLSRASLAYAQRMARKYGVSNIEFMQMDILDLPKCGRQFDVVECTGVLHCMSDPIEGGRRLVACVRKNGLVHISLYSEMARTDIVRLRQEYEAMIGTLDADYIRSFRHRLLLQEPATIDALPTRSDFFDLSRCKDLLFHPLEHRFTIPQLTGYLDELGLKFKGFEPPKPVPNRYWTYFPEHGASRDLTRWNEFEMRYPDAFRDLYETWCIRQ